MEITEEIKTEETLKAFNDNKQNDLFFTLLSGRTIKETITTTRGKFVVKFPKQKDLLFVDRRTAAMRGGIPAENFDTAANYAMQKIAFLDTVIVSGEDWYNNIKKSNKSFSWGDMPDADFVDEVYVKAWSFRCSVQDDLKRNERKADSGLSDNASVQSDVDNGLFSDVASSDK